VVTRNLPDGPFAGFGQLVSDRLELHQHFVGGLVEDLTLFRQDQATGMAVKQLGADVHLQRGDLPRDGRLRQMQLLGGMGEGAGFRGSMKNAQFVPIEWHQALFPSAR
jgi:hypothetical protein